MNIPRVLRLIITLIMSFSIFVLYANDSDCLTISNKTEHDIIICIDRKANQLSCCETKYILDSNKTIKIAKENLTDDLILIFSKKDNTSVDSLFLSETVSIKYNMITNKTLFIIDDSQKFIVIDNFEWELFLTVQKFIGSCNYSDACKFIEEIFDDHSNSKAANPIFEAIKVKIQELLISNYSGHLSSTAVAVIESNEICELELRYLSLRRSKVKKALEIFLNKNLDHSYIPSIAFVISGGGYRAFIGGLGSLVGAEKMKLLDAIMYISCLSGSTWLVNSWLTLGGSITKFKENILPKLKGLFKNLSFHNLKLICDNLLLKYSFNQKITLVDLFGVLLANVLLEDLNDQKHCAYISDQEHLLTDGNRPFPVYSVTSGSSDDRESWWYEITPLQFGSYELNAFIPTWAVGRMFDSGLSTDCAAEQSLGFYMGMCGSAFAARIDQLYSFLFSKPIGKNFPNRMYNLIIKHILDKIGKKRLTAAKIFNFTFNKSTSPIKHVKWLKFVDPAFILNLPYPPVSGLREGRKADIIFLLDFSSEVADASELIKVSEYAYEKKLPFPQINPPLVANKNLMIFKDEHNPDAPVVVYMPRIKDNNAWEKLRNSEEFYAYREYLDNFDAEEFVAKYAYTTNFYYHDFYARQWCSLMEFNMLSSKNVIAEIINWVIEKETLAMAKS